MKAARAAILLLAAASAAVPLRSGDGTAAVADPAPASGVVDSGFPAGKTVRRVIVRGRWSRGLELPLEPGDVLTAGGVSATLRSLRNAIASGRVLENTGRITVLYISVDWRLNADDGTVDVIFLPYHVSMGLTQLGEAVLPLPRSPFPSYLENVPGVLRLLQPALGFGHDDASGTTLQAATSGSLAVFGDSGAPSEAGRARQTLDHQMSGAQSLTESFHRFSGLLGYTRTRAAGAMRELRVSSGYTTARDPLGGGEQQHDAGYGGAGAFLRLGPHTRLVLDAGYRSSRDEVLPPSGPALRTRTRVFDARALVEGLPPAPWEGFFRAAAWWDHGDVDGGAAYDRLALRAGYEREFLVAPSQAVGLELLVGAGVASRAAPEFARFFGGDDGAAFLYDDRGSPDLLTMPRGPVLRSFGRGRAGIAAGPSAPLGGGQAYWHVNLNCSLPIPGLSRPLIPDEETDIPDDTGQPVRLRRVLKQQIHVSGRSMLAQHLVSQGLPPDAAMREATAALEEIRPATEFIIDHANVIAVKPAFMVDAAGLRDRSTGAEESWIALGVGVEVHVVNVKFGAAYYRTVSGPTWGDRDNVAVRLVFRNLF